MSIRYVWPFFAIMDENLENLEHLENVTLFQKKSLTASRKTLLDGKSAYCFILMYS